MSLRSCINERGEFLADTHDQSKGKTDDMIHRLQAQIIF